jgi:putative FmdB family regulatory protein
MPIYEYECEKCGERFDYLSRIFEDEKEIKCPRCGTDKPKKLTSTFNRSTSSDSCLPRGGG